MFKVSFKFYLQNFCKHTYSRIRVPSPMTVIKFDKNKLFVYKAVV